MFEAKKRKFFEVGNLRISCYFSRQRFGSAEVMKYSESFFLLFSP